MHQIVVKNKLAVARSVSDALLSSSSESATRIMLACLRKLSIDRDANIQIQLHEIPEAAGGDKSKLAESLKTDKLLKSLRAFEYFSEYSDEHKVLRGVIAGPVQYKKGALSFKFDEDVLAHLDNQRLIYNLIHFDNIKQLRGATRVKLYVFLAGWDKKGKVDVSLSALKTATKSKSSSLSLFFSRDIVRGIEHINTKLGVDVKVARAKDALSFSWPPGAIFKSAEKQELKLEYQYDPAQAAWLSVLALLREHSIGDPKLPKVLEQLPSQEAYDIVRQGVAEGKTQGVLHDYILARAYEQIISSNRLSKLKELEQAQQAETETRKREAKEETTKVSAWLAGVSDEDLEEHARKSPSTQYYVTKGQSIREAAEESEAYAAALALAAGVIEAE